MEVGANLGRRIQSVGPEEVRTGYKVQRGSAPVGVAGTRKDMALSGFLTRGDGRAKRKGVRTRVCSSIRNRVKGEWLGRRYGVKKSEVAPKSAFHRHHNAPPHKVIFGVRGVTGGAPERAWEFTSKELRATRSLNHAGRAAPESAS